MDNLAERLKSMTPLQRAVFALKETQARLEALERKRTEPIAIVGMACRFPGGASDPASFWRLICDGVDAIGEIPPDRWDVDGFYDPDPTAPGKMCTRWGGFLDQIDLFDNHFFGISDREAARIDPQQRMLLELAWEALEDAGLPPSRLRGTKTGTFIGISISEYGIMLSTDLAQTDAHAAAGTSLCLAANRLSFTFGIQGPSVAMDTACSSSIVALHLACQSIRNGECEAALVGGVNLLLSPIGTVNLTKSGLCATDGRIRAFDADASGYVRSEGAGVVVIKPLDAAIKNNDPIYAVIRGSAVNQNISSNGLTAPSRPSQEQVLREAYARAGVSPGQVKFVETQGTGTKLGDAMEATALGNVLREGRSNGDRCSIGTVKTNIGHMETASGMASLMKVAMALKYRQLPPNLHFHTPNPDIPFATLPIQVQSKLEPWPDADHPRFGAVSAFGFGGSNSHVVLQEAPAVEPLQAAEKRPRLLPLSARTEAALADLVGQYVDFLGKNPPSWADVCHTAGARRDHHDCRVVVLADSPEAAIALLKTSNTASANVFSGRKPFGRDLRIAFLYDDQPSVWQNCCKSLLANTPNFAAATAEIDATLQSVAGWTFAAMCDDPSRWNDPSFARTSLVALQLALTAWWRRIGLTPTVVLGRGAGEFAAACTAGILTPEEALRLAIGGGQLPGVQARPAALPLVSSVDGKAHNGSDLDASHWARCLGSGSFATALDALKDRSIDIGLEMGPKFVGQSGSVGVVLPTMVEQDNVVDVLHAIATLYAAGADIAWQHLATGDARCVRVPTYPWQRQRLWAPTSQWQAASASNNAPQAVEAAEPSGDVRKRPDLITPYVAPRTPLEQKMVDAWTQVLGLDRVGVHDSFFELGGDSLQAAILLNLVASGLGRQLSIPLRDLFQTPTIAGLAERIESATSDESSAQPPLVPIARDGELPLSLNQEALWFLDRLEPDRPTYMLHLALNVRGPLNIPALEQALNEIARRHEVFRTTFPEVNGGPVQVIAPPKPASLPVIDLSDLPESEREEELRRRIAAEMRRPIDLSNGPLIRITLLRRAKDDYAAVTSTHHIIHDGWSMGIVLRELATLYPAYAAGRLSPLPELPVQYVDFSAWQRQLLQGETLERLRGYWQDQLVGTPPLELPTDHPRPAVRTTRGSSRPCRLSPETSAAVLEFCRREGVTPFMTLLAAFEVLLARYAGQNDFAVGVPVANRNKAETESLIGYFVNVVVLRTKLKGDPTFREAVLRTRQTALDGFERQEMTLDQVVDAVKPPRDLSRNPIFQVMFALQNIKLPAPPEMELEISPYEDCPAPPSANFDLTLELFERNDTFEGGLGFSTDLFLSETIDRMIEQFEVLVATAVREPDRTVSALPLLGDAESRAMIDRWNDTARPYDRTRPIHRLFEEHARATPDATAIVAGDERWTYSQLNAKANQIAHHLRNHNIGPETRVGVCMERSPELFAAVLGIMKAGGAYVPLDPAYTHEAAERTKYVIESSQVALVVTTVALADSIDVPVKVVLDGASAEPIASQSGENVDGGANADSLAYILYTSGSTGRPKGVMVTHGNLINAYYGWLDAYRLDTEVRSHLQMASFGFDVFAGDFIRAFGSGGKLVVCRKEILLDAERLLDLLRREQIDAAEFVPVVMRNLVQYLQETEQTLDSMRLAIVGSDVWYVADHQQAKRVLGKNTRLINSYGLTETTIDSSYFEGDVRAMADGSLTPIGRPLANTRLYVLDEQMRPTPIGVAGGLYIGGDGVSRGYVNAELNAERFPIDPFSSIPNSRMCRTGDRARRRADGQIEFLGRADNQVKIRGFRVEPGEIEHVLREHPSLSQAVVTARQRTAGDVQLVGYVVMKLNAAFDATELRGHLVGRLPDYMIPSAFVALDALPTTSSGKIDRKSLPDPDWGNLPSRTEYVAPKTSLEQQVAGIWAELLNIEKVGTQDNFFDLGGNSLLALRLAARVRKDIGVEVPLVTLFTSPTVGLLAAAIEQLRQQAELMGFVTGPQVDWDAETQLDPVIRAADDLASPVLKPSRVLLTGATGFLGAFLLRELLEQTDADIYCLVRADDVEAGRKKIARILEQYHIQGVGASARIVPICGDLAQPRLGLSDDAFRELAASIDAIYHNGAQVSSIYPYQMLRAANVGGTIEVLRLATQSKLKPLHFVSTISVFDSPEYLVKSTIDETQPLVTIGSLTTGYARTKCVAEKLVRAAAARGLPTAIYRPGRIAADSEHGAGNMADEVTIMAKLCIELGALPTAEETAEINMAPVDFVSRAIVALSRQKESLGSTFHLMNPKPVAVRKIYRAMLSSGFNLQELPFAQWRSRMIEHGSHSKNDMLAGFAHLLAADAAHQSQSPEDSVPKTSIECSHTTRRLDQLAVQCPTIDDVMLSRYFQFLGRRIEAEAAEPSREGVR